MYYFTVGNPESLPPLAKEDLREMNEGPAVIYHDNEDSSDDDYCNNNPKRIKLNCIFICVLQV